MIRSTIECSLPLAASAILAFAAGASAQSSQSSVLYDYSGAAGDHMGAAVAELGDIDGDSRADYAVGAVGASNWRGQVRVFSGSRGTLLYTVDGVAAGDRFGHSLAALPDLDGDGIGEFVVGAPLASGATSACGQVYVRSGADGSPLYVRGGAGANDHMGWSVASIGDVNNDGVGDFAGGAIDDDNFGSSSGSVRVWSGASSGMLFDVFGSAANQLFGTSIAPVGDQNHDGVSDFAVGGPHNPGSASKGLVRIISGFDHSVLSTLNGLNSGDNFGFSVAAIGDLDGDGRSDLAIGSTQVSPASTGQVDVCLAAGGPPLHRVFGVGMADKFGACVSAAGDVDHDGTPDFAVGAPGADLPNAINTGSVTLFSGANGGVLATHHGVDVGMPIGSAISGSGDVNEDGSSELVIGSPGNLGSPSDPGGALVFSTEPLSFWATGFVVSAASPTSPVMSIDVGSAHAGESYRVLGSITGLAPKTTVGGVQMPLVADRYFKHTLVAPSNALLQGAIGQLDSNGRAQTTFTPTPALLTPAFLGLTLYHAAIVIDAQGLPVLASNPLPVTLVP